MEVAEDNRCFGERQYSLKMINYQLKAKYGSQEAWLASYKSYLPQLEGKEN